MSENVTAIAGHSQSACPHVSVVIPTRGRAGLLAQCVGSVLLQTFDDIEVIVVVDGLDPATTDFLSKIVDDRLTYVAHPESRGVSNARNTGIDLATGRWIAFCDDDDVWAPTKLAAQLRALSTASGARWAIAGAIRANQDLRTAFYPPPPSAAEVAAALPYWNPVPGGGSGVIAERRLVIDVGGFDPRLSAFADWGLWAQLSERSLVAVAAEPLVGYRDHGGAMTRRLRGLEEELRVIGEQCGSRLAASGRRFPADEVYVWAVEQTFRTGDWRGGLNLLVSSRRLRSVLPRWLWIKGRHRFRVLRGTAEPAQLPHRMVTVTDFPWLAPIVGASADTSGDTPDAAARHEPGGDTTDVARTGSTFGTAPVGVRSLRSKP